MRVIAGKYKKRQLKVPKSQLTRPTTDKNKENLFNMIGPYFQGGTVLDLFGGSGGLGIEAISRGCNTLYSVDHQYEAFKTIKENFSLLKLENCFPLKMDYKKALKRISVPGGKLPGILQFKDKYCFINICDIYAESRDIPCKTNLCIV